MRTKEKPSLPVPANDSPARSQWEIGTHQNRHGQTMARQILEPIVVHRLKSFPTPCTSRIYDTGSGVSPSILLTYGSMSTSCRCWCVCAW